MNRTAAPIGIPAIALLAPGGRDGALELNYSVN